MRSYIRRSSPEVFFIFSAAIGAVIAGALTLYEPLNMGFWLLWGILLSFDVVTYIAMKAGWIRTPRQRSGIDS